MLGYADGVSPETVIAAGSAITLAFTASYDAGVLGLPVGTAVRVEVIVSFGNAAAGGSTAANIDINGNGAIDADEARVASVSVRLEDGVPASTTLPNPTLSDGIADIASAGTATFSNPVFTLGTTSRTVTVHYDGGASGGSLTNCAHLRRPPTTKKIGSFTISTGDGLDLQAWLCQQPPAPL